MPKFPGEVAISEKLRMLKTPHLHVVMGNIQQELDRREKKDNVRLAGKASTPREKLLAEIFLCAKHGILLSKSVDETLSEFDRVYAPVNYRRGRPGDNLTPLETMIFQRFDIEALVAVISERALSKTGISNT